LTELAQFWHYMLYHLEGGLSDNTNSWPLPQRLLGEHPAMFHTVVIASGMLHALRSFEALGVPDEIVRDTMSDIGLYVRMHHVWHGTWGQGEPQWLRRHVRARIFRLGRLQYVPATFSWPFRAFRNRQTGEIITLCDSGREYRTDGLAQGTNGTVDPNPWVSEYREKDGCIIGSPVTDAGEAVRTQVRLKSDEWEQVLAPGDRVLDMHIPRGERLTPEISLGSFCLAKEFFPRHFPETKFVAFTCSSWMLDPNLRLILPEESNLVQFERLWNLLATAGDETGCFVFVFENRNVDLLTAPRDTALRRAVIDWLNAGNHMRGVAGFVMWDDPRLVQEGT
jgi:hypothetical protein